MGFDVTAKYLGALALFVSLIFAPAKAKAAADAIYAGTHGSGIFKSIDGGATWADSSTY